MPRGISRKLKKEWEDKLKEHGLGMDAGRDPGHRKLKYIGDSRNLDVVAVKEEQKVTERVYGRRIKPKKQAE